MQERNSQCVCIVLTGYPAVESAVEGVRLGNDDFSPNQPMLTRWLRRWEKNLLRDLRRRPRSDQSLQQHSIGTCSERQRVVV